MLEIRTNFFRLHQPQYSNSGTHILPYFIEDEMRLIKAATQILEQIYRDGFAYHKAGIVAFDLLPRNEFIQLDLFSALSTNNPRNIKLTQALDLVNKRYGRGTIFPAACGKKLTGVIRKKYFSFVYGMLYEPKKVHNILKIFNIFSL